MRKVQQEPLISPIPCIPCEIHDTLKVFQAGPCKVQSQCSPKHMVQKTHWLLLYVVYSRVRRKEAYQYSTREISGHCKRHSIGKARGTTQHTKEESSSGETSPTSTEESLLMSIAEETKAQQAEYNSTKIQSPSGEHALCVGVHVTLTVDMLCTTSVQGTCSVMLNSTGVFPSRQAQQWLNQDKGQMFFIDNTEK